MNLLYEPLPESVVVDGVSYPVVTNFRDWIAFFDMMADDSYSPKDKLMASMGWFTKEVPENSLNAWEALLQFASCEDSPGNSDEDETEKDYSQQNSKTCFSWVYDSAYILGAYRQCYGMDLISMPFLHWYEFMALFEALPEDVPLKKRIGYRSINLAQIKDKERRKQIEKIRRNIAIPQNPMNAGQVGAFF